MPAGGEAGCEFKVTPRLAGPRTLTVLFESKELDDVDGLLEVAVKEKKPDVEGGHTNHGRAVTRE